MENEYEALPGVACPRVRDNRSTLNTKTGYDDDDDLRYVAVSVHTVTGVSERGPTSNQGFHDHQI